MAIDNMTTWDSLLKEHYDGQTVAALTYSDRPLMALLPKNEGIKGRNHPLPVIYGDVQNRSATFASAIALTSGVQNEQFTMTMVKNYSNAFIDRQLLKSSDASVGAFASAVIAPVDSALNALSNDLAFSLFRKSSGARGQVFAEPSEAATTVITLKSIKDISGFDVNQSIVIYSAESGGSQRTYDGSVTAALISAIDRNLGTITINTTYSSSGSIAANDYIFVAGDRGLKCSGLGDWIPDSAPAATAFFGVDRTADVVRLAGNRTTGTGMTVEEALLQSAFDVADIGGGAPDVAVLNFKQYGKLIKTLGSKVQYIDMDVNGVVGFRGVMVHGAAGPIKVVADRFCPDQKAYLLEMKSWELMSTGPLVGLMDDDMKMLRQASADAYEVRCGSYYNLGCKAPGHNGVVSLDA